MRLMPTASLVLSLGLAACGGGGGDSGTGTTPINPVGDPLAITSANYLLAAHEGLSAGFSLLNLTDLAGAGFTTVLLPSGTYTCDNGVGTISVSTVDADNNGVPSTGDTETLVMTGCQIDNAIFNGTLGFAPTNWPTSVTYPYTRSLALTYSNVTIQSGTVATSANGTLGLDTTVRGVNDQTSHVTAASFRASATSATESFSRTLTNFVLDEVRTPSGASYVSAIMASGTVTSTALGGKSVAVATLVPFVGNTSQTFPSSGQARVSGLAGSQVRVTALDSTTLQLELDADGNGLYETLTTAPWSSMVL